MVGPRPVRACRSAPGGRKRPLRRLMPGRANRMICRADPKPSAVSSRSALKPRENDATALCHGEEFGSIRRWIEFWILTDDNPRSTSLDYPRNRIGVLHYAGNGADLRPELSSLHTGLRVWRWLYRLQLYLDCSVQCDGLGPGCAMLRQSIFRAARTANAAALLVFGRVQHILNLPA